MDSREKSVIQFNGKKAIRLAIILCASFLLSFILSLALPGIFTLSENKVTDRLFELRYALKGK
jgi:CHASE2 domain-containing sensor protein